MNPFSNYIDRQKSGLGSSEKSQKVHSANWKEEIQLRKELFCLGRQEEQRVSRISSDQRLVVHRFHRKLSRSVEVAQNHEKLKEAYENKHAKWEAELQNHVPSDEKVSRTRLRCLSASPKPPVPKFRRSKSCEPPKLQRQEFELTYTGEAIREGVLRPMTALERRNKVWERQLNSVTQRLNRARSAPARSHLYKVPEFSVSTESCSGGGRKKGIRCRRPVAFEIDMEQVRRAREYELVRQREAVQGFLKNIESLELDRWSSNEDHEVSKDGAETLRPDDNGANAADANSDSGRVRKVSARNVGQKRQPFSAWT